MATSLVIGGPVPTWRELGGSAQHRMKDVPLRFDSAWLEPLTGTVGPIPIVSGRPDEILTNWTVSSGSWTVVPAADEDFAEVLYQYGLDVWEVERAGSLATGQGFRLYLKPAIAEATVQFDPWSILVAPDGGVQIAWGGEQVANHSFKVEDGEPMRLAVWNIGDVLILKLEPDWAGGIAVPAPQTYWDGGAPYAIAPAKVRVSGVGTALLAWRALEWTSSWTVELAEPLWLAQPSRSSTVQSAAHGWSDALQSAAITVYDEFGFEWATTREKFGFRWSVTTTSAGGSAFPWLASWLYRVDVFVPPLLSATADNSETLDWDSFVWTRGIDPADHTLEASIKSCQGEDTTSYLEPGLRLDLVRDGATVFSGLTTAPQHEDDGADLLTVRASASERLYAGGLAIKDIAGMTLAAAMGEAFGFAGIDSGDVDVSEAPLVVVDTRSEEGISPTPGGTGGEFLDYLLEQFASTHVWRPGPNFTYSIAARRSGVDAGTFGRESDSDVPTYRPLRQEWAEANFFNVVVVVGEDRFGQPLSAIGLRDWRSENPPVPRVLVIRDTGLRTQNLVDLAAYMAFREVSRRRRRLFFEADELEDAQPGDTVTLEGVGDFVLTRIQWHKDGLEEHWLYEAEEGI